MPTEDPAITETSNAVRVERVGFLPRLGAEIIDVIATGALVLILVGGSFLGLGAIGAPDEVIVITMFLLGNLGFIAYWTILHAHGNQTLGKFVIGAVVVDTHLRPIGYARALGRLFAEIVSAIPFNLGYLWAIWDPQRQTFHDKIASTLVVRKADPAD